MKGRVKCKLPWWKPGSRKNFTASEACTCACLQRKVYTLLVHLSTIVALIATRSSLVTRALAFQAASRVNNIAADYTHLTGMKSVMKGGIYVYSQLNANRKSINLAFMLSPFNEVL